MAHLRRTFTVLAGTLGAAVVASTLPGHALVASADTSGPWFGVLQADGTHAAEERAAGISVGELELNWGAYEPAPGQFDSGYISSVQSRLVALRSAGLQVILDTGLQYPPAWIFSVDGSTRFVDQYGDVWHGSLSEDVPDAVFDSAVRQAEAAYIARVAQDLGDVFYAVRAGGLLQDELRYPHSDDNGHSNCYWAFSAAAQAASPVPGWRPGTADGRAATFMNWYLQSITGFETWLLGTYRAHFSSADLQLLMPSWGLRPGDVDAAVASNLDGSTPPAGWGTLEMGLDWSRQVAAISDSRVQLYNAWMERGDDGSTATTLAPAHYLVTLGAPKGLSVVGENASPDDSSTDMQTIVGRARAWGLAGLMWLDEPSLYSTSASLAEYAGLIGTGAASAPTATATTPPATTTPAPPASTGSAAPSTGQQHSSGQPAPATASTGGASYWLVAADGGIFSYGAPFYGSTGAMRLSAPIVGMAPTGDHRGYWLLGQDGGIFSFGDAVYHGSTGAMDLNRPVVGMAPTPDGGGYWLVASDGGIFSFGDASYHGSLGGTALVSPIVGIAPTPSGQGYWLVAADGGVFSFGDALFAGSAGGRPLGSPVVGIAADATGQGYWLAQQDGSVLAFGDAGYHGDVDGVGDVTGIHSTPDGQGYWLSGRDGGVFSLGDAGYAGSAGSLHLAQPVVGMGA